MKVKRISFGGAKRRSIWEAFNKICQKCGTETILFKPRFYYSDDKPVAHIDHIVPISKGGPHIDSNFQLLCAHCNLSKRNFI